MAKTAKKVLIRVGRSHDQYDEGQVFETELDEDAVGRISAGYWEVIDGGEDKAPARQSEPPTGAAA